MDPIQQRYHFEKQVLSTVNGTLHEGKDLSLQRQVFLYQIRANKQTTNDETKRLLGGVSYFANPSFFHMMDLGESKDGVYVVLEYRTGDSLLDLINSKSLSLAFPQVLNLIKNLGETMQDALEERVRGFSVTAENIWLDRDQLMVINYWAEGDAQQRGVLGLIHLFYQILFQAPTLPADADVIEKQLSLSIEPFFPEKKEQFAKLIRRVLKGHESLSTFLLELRALNEDQTQTQNREIEQIKHKPVVEMEMQEAQKSPKLARLTKRTAITGGLLLLLIMGFAFYTIMGPEESAPSSLPKESPKPVMTNEKAAANPPIEIKTAPLPSSDHTVQVPDLRGLSREEAEKLVLSYGLHYKYFMENNDQQQGLVFKQDPESGTEVPKGGYLTFWISKGSAQ